MRLSELNYHYMIILNKTGVKTIVQNLENLFLKFVLFIFFVEVSQREKPNEIEYLGLFYLKLCFVQQIPS